MTVGSVLENSRDTLCCLARLFDRLNASQQTDELSSLIHSEFSKQIDFGLFNAANLVREHVFFVWLGSISITQLEYFDYWRKSNPVRTVVFYFDSQALLAHKINSLLCRLNAIEDWNHKLMIKRQNAFYLAFEASNYDSLDEWLINYASRYDKAEAEVLSLELAKSRETYAQYLEQGICRDIHSIDGLMNFKGKDLTKYYFYELILRNNLASASDILRLMILYKIGGTYLDFDTLPCIEHCFRDTNEHYKKQVDFNLVDIVKAEMVLSRVRSLHILDFNQRDDHLSNILSGCVGIDSALTNCLFRDVDRLDDRAIFKPLEDQYVFKHGLKLSKSKRGLGEFNNNALVAHAGSKTVSIIIRQMLKRYAYIEKMGAIFSGDIVSNGDDEYWSRLIDYRNDALCSTRNVTLFLTGPSLILETILSLSYELLDIDDVSPFTVSTLMQIPALGMSFTEQTQFTSEHMRSTWQSNDNLFTEM